MGCWGYVWSGLARTERKQNTSSYRQHAVITHVLSVLIGKLKIRDRSERWCSTSLHMSAVAHMCIHTHLNEVPSMANESRVTLQERKSET